jgi:hypothetical protein
MKGSFGGSVRRGENLLVHVIRPAHILTERKQPDKLDDHLAAIAVRPRIARTSQHVCRLSIRPIGWVELEPRPTDTGRSLPNAQVPQQSPQLLSLRRVNDIIDVSETLALGAGRDEPQMDTDEHRSDRHSDASAWLVPALAPAGSTCFQDSHLCSSVFICGQFRISSVRGSAAQGVSGTARRLPAAGPHFSANLRPFSPSSFSASMESPGTSGCRSDG